MSMVRFLLHLQIAIFLLRVSQGTQISKDLYIEDYENYFNEIEVDDKDAETKTRNALNSPFQRWPERTLYFKIATSYTPQEIANVHKALEFFNENTCLTFMELRESDVDIADKRYVFFNKSTNLCGTKVGYNPLTPIGAHNVLLSNKCLAEVGIIQHETQHVLGLFHEQSRQDRSKYIHVEYSNIPAKYWSQFMMYPPIYTTTYNIPYDYNSLMHYNQYAFSKDSNKPSMLAKVGNTLVERNMGQSRGPSLGDLEKINLMYKCE